MGFVCSSGDGGGGHQYYVTQGGILHVYILESEPKEIRSAFHHANYIFEN